MADRNENAQFQSGGSQDDSQGHAPKRVTFDDFQIQRSVQQAQVDEEKRVWKERMDRLEEQKAGFLKFSVPRLRSRKEENLGSKNPFSFLFKSKSQLNTNGSEASFTSYEETYPEEPQLVVRVASPTKRNLATVNSTDDAVDFQTNLESGIRLNGSAEKISEPKDTENALDRDMHLELLDSLTSDSEVDTSQDRTLDESVSSSPNDLSAADFQEHTTLLEEEPIETEDVSSEDEQATEPGANLEEETNDVLPVEQFRPLSAEPQIDATLNAFLGSLRGFDTPPRRASEARDPRADFVLLLSEQLEILREQLDASTALFFWVNNKKQQLVLESRAISDATFPYFSTEKRFPIELDAISMVVNRSKPELHSSISPQAELDLIPYYTDAIGIASFAAMPVLFGDALVAVLTVDSLEEEKFNAETLRLLTNHARLISGLIRSYIEKYDLLSSARTLESARKLHQIVNTDSSLRVIRDQRRTPDYILRALAEAASEIIDWEWLATAAFDEVRRVWCIQSLQSKHTQSYVPPQTPITLEESIVGKCLSSGKSARVDQLTVQSVRYSLEEERGNASGHSFMVIPIRTTSRNYGALAIEHSERARFTDADVETLEHLARSAASALEIMALSEIVEERALTDLLSGILNKRGLNQRLGEELARAMEFDEPITLVLFEIDGAAEFFSRFSQEDSDTIVLAVTRLLRFGARVFDVIARIGEHSFAAVLIRMTDEDAYLWSEKMRKMIVSEVIAIGKRSFSVTVSIGVSGARRDGTTEELTEGALLAVDRAKELGGNNVIVY